MLDNYHNHFPQAQWILLKTPLDLISEIIQQYSLRFRPRTARYNGTGKSINIWSSIYLFLVWYLEIFDKFIMSDGIIISSN